MLLNELAPVPGSNYKAKRVGRGIGSGKGKTCGSGTKGQRSRTGVAINGFEGGQMPIHRRLPKRGFNPLNRKEYVPVNTGDLSFYVEEKMLNAGDLVDNAKLVELGLLKKVDSRVKLLGDGELTVSLKFNLAAYSKSATAAIESSNGQIVN
ncbi:MAG: 50S ribosomal protein L15 [Alphaproteobacteria bacterium]|nr:50S ribosomal protein L15 [Alphaproteobacteria bacterium]OJV16368.1 MAG: 50S ribosomal protein L15 [Alphaproteobacteria bacterium 33-17]